MITRILTLTFAAVALASCGKDDSAATGVTHTPLHVTASVEGATRAFDTQWEHNDQIGISGQSGNLSYTNVPYRCADLATGAFEPAGMQTVYFGDETGKFGAYYPYTQASGMSDGKIAAAIGNQYDRHSFDFLYAQPVDARKDAPDINFVFTHRMSKLVLHMYPGAGIGHSIGERYRIGLSQLHAEGTFDPATGATTVTGDARTLTFRHQDNIAAVVDTQGPSDAVYYTLILFPETVAGGVKLTLTELERTTDNPLVTYSATLRSGTDGNLTLEPGKVYDYKVTVNKTGIVLSGGTITDWAPGELPDDGEVEVTL